MIRLNVNGHPHEVDADPATVAVLRAHRKARGAMALQLARDDALVFADHEGRHLQPEHFSRSFADALRRCSRQLGAAAPPAVRLDLRHTHATVRFDRWRPGARRLTAPRPREPGCHADRVRARCAGQPARGC